MLGRSYQALTPLGEAWPLKSCSYHDLSTLLLWLQLMWPEVIQLVQWRASLQLSFYEASSDLWLKQSSDSEWVARCCWRKPFCGVRWGVNNIMGFMPTGNQKFPHSQRSVVGFYIWWSIHAIYRSSKGVRICLLEMHKQMILCWPSIK